MESNPNLQEERFFALLRMTHDWVVVILNEVKDLMPK
jgi:hypothetical protein